MRKITEKFERDFGLDCDEDVAKRVFYLTENRIRLDFHFGDGRITKSSRVFNKDGQCQVIQVYPHSIIELSKQRCPFRFALC